MRDREDTSAQVGARRRAPAPAMLAASLVWIKTLAVGALSGCAIAPPMSDPGPAPDPAPFTTAQRATAGTLGFGRLSTTIDDAGPRIPDAGLASAGRAVLGDALGVPSAQPGTIPDLRLSVLLTALRRDPDGGALVGRLHLSLEAPQAGAPLWQDTVTARGDAPSALLRDALRRAAARAPFRRALLASASPSRQVSQPRVPSEAVPAGTLTLRGAPIFLAPLAIHAGDLAPTVASVLRDGAASGVAVILSPDGWAITGAAAVGAADVVRVRLSDGRSPWARVLRRGPDGAVVLLGITAERLSALPLRPTPPEAGEALFSLAPTLSKGGGGATIALWSGVEALNGSGATAGALVDAWANGVALLGTGPHGAPAGPMPLTEALARLNVHLITPPPQETGGWDRLP
jgi:hypothetical protein